MATLPLDQQVSDLTERTVELLDAITYKRNILDTAANAVATVLADANTAVSTVISQATAIKDATNNLTTAASASATLAQNFSTATNNTFTGSGGYYGALKYANDAAGSATTASLWATSMTVVQTGLYGAKYYATDASASATTAKNWATQLTTEVFTGQGYSARQYATNAGSSASAASTSATSAQNWATQMTTEVVAGQGYSAKQYASNAAGSATAANTSAGLASGSATTAQQWATNTVTMVDGISYGAKKYATDAATDRALANKWATLASGEVNGVGSGYSALYWAGQSSTSAGLASGSAVTAQNWATSLTVVSNGQYGALKYSTDAAASASLANKWATQSTGEVNGVGSGYSAYYWANQAANSAAQATNGQLPSDWNQTVTTAKDYIKNKPTIPTQYTDALARAAIGVSGSLTYNSTTGVITAPVLATVATSGSKSDVGLGNVENKALSTYGIGITTAGPTAIDIDSTTMESGMYYTNSSSLGTFPVSATGGFLLTKVYGNAGFQQFQPYGTSTMYFRSRSTTWQPWVAIHNSVSLTKLSQLTNDSGFLTTVPVTSVAGRTGAVVLAKTDVGLGNVDNTSDVNKPVSTAQQTALDLKASITYVDTKVSNLVGTAPAALDTLNELATALGNDANFATTTATSLGNRLRVDAAQGLSIPQQTQGRSNLGLAAVASSGSKADVGLSNVDNTSDVSKPVSTAQQTALDLKANKSNDTLIKPTIKGYIEQFQTLNPGATVTLDPQGNGTLIKITTTVANTTITLPAFVAGMSYTVVIKWGATGHTATFAGGTLSWGSAGIPTSTSVAGKKDKYIFTCDDECTMGQDGGRGF